MSKRRVLFLCTGNSARSQIAEGWLRQLAGDHFEVHSAGTAPKDRVNPLAVEVMAEVGIDVSRQQPKHLDRFVGEPWDYVITVCDRAKDTCPVFPGGKEQIHWSFDDPAAAEGDAAERLAVFRRVRNEIGQRLRLFVAAQVRPAERA
jgi:arsenate reductase (thioredoxin)